MTDTNQATNTPRDIVAQALSEADRFEQLKVDLDVIRHLILTADTAAESAAAIRRSFAPCTTERHTYEIMERISLSIAEGMGALMAALAIELNQCRELQPGQKS